MIQPSRRSFLLGLTGAAVAAAANPSAALAKPPKSAPPPVLPAAPVVADQPRRLVMAHAHVKEFIKVDDVLDPANKQTIEWFFRDWRQNETHPLDERLLLGLCDLWQRADKSTMTLISGYRTERTNRLVGGVKESQHKTGIAADIAFADLSTGALIKLARQTSEHCQLARGEYPTYGFVHLDAGPMRCWVGGKPKSDHA